ncbi:hypothetical protein ACF0H5_012005 [Mactra antiquata]
MKLSVAIVVAIACMVGLVLADYGSYSYAPYYPTGQSAGGFGDNTFLMLIGFLFLIFVLFGFSGQDTITLVNVTTK